MGKATCPSAFEVFLEHKHDLDLFLLKFNKRNVLMMRIFFFCLCSFASLRISLVIFQFNLPIINSPHPLLSHFWSSFFLKAYVIWDILVCLTYTVMFFLAFLKIKFEKVSKKQEEENIFKSLSFSLFRICKICKSFSESV